VKRRERFPRVDGYPVGELEIGGEASIVQSANQGGVFVEYLTPEGFGHAVPVEALDALGWGEPSPATDQD
jgi:hypothetical protein